MHSWSRPGGSGGPDAEPLPQLLVRWRRRADRSGFPGLPADDLPERPGGGLSRRDVARLTGVAESWYAALEDGADVDCSEYVLDRLSTALRLSFAERAALYLRTVGQLPTSSAIPQAEAAVEMDELFQRFIDAQPPPALMVDVAWNVVGHNQPMRDWFPWTAYQGNMMRWALLSRDAREQLVNWREDWARPYVSQIRYARSHRPRNEALRRLERDILARSPEAREMWHRHETLEHGDGNVRRLRLPHHRDREVVVRIVGLRPMRSDGLKIFVLLEDRPTIIGS